MKFTFPNISIFNNMSDDMGIDLGTANTLAVSYTHLRAHET